MSKDVLGTAVATVIVVLIGILLPPITFILGSMVVGYFIYKLYEELKSNE